MKEFYAHTTIYMKMKPNENIEEATARCWELIHSVGLDCGDLYGDAEEYPTETSEIHGRN